MKLGLQVGLGPGHIVLDGDPAPSSPSPKGGQSHPIFGPYLLHPNGCRDQDATWYGGRAQMGTPLLPPQKGGRAPEFSAHVYCGQTAGWIKMVVGMELGLGPDDIVLDGDLAPTLLKKGGRAPLLNFWPMSIVAKRLDVSRWHLAWRWAFVHATLC